MSRLALAFAFACTLMSGSLALAQAWPNRPITLVVPNPPGSSNDLGARVLARELTTRLGTPVLVENRSGADGTLGTQYVTRSAPDGYTFVFSSESPFTAAPYLYSKLGYDPEKDLTPVSLIGRAYYTLVVTPSLKVKSVNELIKLAKSKPNSLNYSSIGEASKAYLGMALFMDMTGTKLEHIPYKTSAQSIIDVASGVIQTQFATVTAIMPLVEGKKIEVLAITSKNRSQLLPDVPTMAEAGLSDYELDFWVGVFGPAGIPDSIVTRLHKEIVASVASDQVKASLLSQGVEPEIGSPSELGALLKSDIKKAAREFERAGIPRR